MLEQTDIGSHLHGGLGDAAQSIDYDGIHFTGIGLARDIIAGRKAHLLRDHGIQTVDFVIIPFEQFQEGSLGAGGAFAAEQAQAGQDVVDLAQVDHELLDPEGGPFSDCGRLGRLEMGKSQGGQIFVFIREGSQSRDHVDQFFADQAQGLPHDYDICIVAYVAAGRAQVDDSFGFGALQPIGVNMAHDIMPDHFFSGFCILIVDIGHMSPELFDLLIGNGQAKLFFRLSQGHPEAAPCAELHVGRKDILHFPAGISFGQGTYISVICHSVLFLS